MDPASLERILRRQQEQFLQAQNRLIETLTQQFQTQQTRKMRILRIA